MKMQNLVLHQKVIASFSALRKGDIIQAKKILNFFNSSRKSGPCDVKKIQRIHESSLYHANELLKETISVLLAVIRDDHNQVYIHKKELLEKERSWLSFLDYEGIPIGSVIERVNNEVVDLLLTDLLSIEPYSSKEYFEVLKESLHEIDLE